MIIQPTDLIRFNETSLDVYEIGGQKWLRVAHICDSLQVIKKTFDRTFKQHKSEFGPEETGVIQVPTSGGAQMVRVFSPRGAARIAMLSRSPYAALFRDKVLDVLEGLTDGDDRPIAEVEGIAPGVLSGLRQLFLARRNNTQMVRYLALGLGSSEIARLLGVTKNDISSRRRMAEFLGLAVVSPDLERYQETAAFMRLTEGRERARSAYDERQRRLASAAEDTEFKAALAKVRVNDNG